jgi:hypothetical protein
MVMFIAGCFLGAVLIAPIVTFVYVVADNV